MTSRRLTIALAGVAVWVGLTAAVAVSATPEADTAATSTTEASTTSQSPSTSASPSTSVSPSTSSAPTTSATPTTSSAPTTTVTSTTTVPTTSTAPTTTVPGSSVPPNPGDRTVVVSAGPAGSITVSVTDMILTLDSWDIVGFAVEELEQRNDRIELDLSDGSTEVELKVRLKDSGELDIRLEVE